MQRAWLLPTCLLCAGLGFTAGILVDSVPLLELDREVDLVALLALVWTAWVSAILYRRFDQVKHSDQLRKSTLLDRLSETLQNLRRVDDLIHVDGIPHHDAVALSTRCRREFTAYVEYAKSLDVPVEGGTDGKFTAVCCDLKDLLTSTPVRGTTSEPDIEVIDDKIYLQRNRRAELEKNIDLGRGLIYEIQRQVIEKLR
jgi:hypothetical protein